jgi:hypothetical protein
MKIDPRHAEAIVREEAAQAESGRIDPVWQGKIEELSRLCEERGSSRTHIAFLGTSILARSLDRGADLRIVKPSHARGNANAYSARSLCHGTLVPLSAELGFSLGVNGREPLNNQPYFRMVYLGDATPVRGTAKAAFDYMVGMVDELQGSSPDNARLALRAFIAVRRRYQRRYTETLARSAISPEKLISAIRQLVSEDSEGGRRAQAVVAGLLDVVEGSGRVESGRVNDPSRHYPGDVAVLATEGVETDARIYEKALEVRDKPVRFSDVAVFGRTCVERGVREAAMVLVSERQAQLDGREVREWSATAGVSMTLFTSWAEFAEQCLFWAPSAKPEAALMAVDTIRDRLIEVEASPKAVEMWEALAS